MSLDRLTRERLYKDEELFNHLLPFAKWDPDYQIFVHSDATFWSVWELQPRILTATSDGEAFNLCRDIQEMLDSLDHHFAVQVNWMVNFEIEDMLSKSVSQYPATGPAGWMARRWVKMLRQAATSGVLQRKPRRMRLFLSFRYSPAWRKGGMLQEAERALRMLFGGKTGVSADQRRAEYAGYANKFKGEVDGKVSKLRDLGLRPIGVDGQGLINLLYPVLNKRSTKSGKFRRGRNTAVPVPTYDPSDLLANQISETSVEHPEHGVIKKDGRYYRSVSMVKGPKQCLPLMTAPLQSMPYEHILSITYAKDPHTQQLKRLDALDSSLGFREMTGLGRSNQKVQHQIRSIRAARESLYNNSCQIVRVGVHQTFICGTKEEAIRASSEALASFPSLHGARGMVHEIADMGVFVNSLPAAYDPVLDGRGWTTSMQSSRAVRMFPLWGNWKGSQGTQFLVPSLWNRELVGFDLFDSSVAPNVLISGVSGAGKSYLLCYLLIVMNRGHFATLPTGQRIERPTITFVFDKGMPNQPCGFEKVAKLFHGRIYEASPSKAPAMNFLNRLGETPHDQANEDFKDLIDICSSIVCDMCSENGTPVSRLHKTDIINAILEGHRLYKSGPMKRQFILSDLAAVLRAPKKVDEDEASAARRHELCVLMSEYYGDGTYARFFDRPGALKLKERFIVFDLKGLNRNQDLQNIFLKIAMLWADEVMNDPKELDTRKILVFDEAHDLIGKTDASTIESAFRLYRKRKGIVIAASQSGEDFYVGAGGQAIVQNSAHKIFLRQDPNKFHLTAKAFNLTEQQADVVLRLRTVKGVESQFYLISDIGEAALVLPLEPAFYWVSTNNGDDNQLLANLLQQTEGDFWRALELAVAMAPNGASVRNEMAQNLQKQSEVVDQSAPVAQALDLVYQDNENQPESKAQVT